MDFGLFCIAYEERGIKALCMGLWYVNCVCAFLMPCCKMSMVKRWWGTKLHSLTILNFSNNFRHYEDVLKLLKWPFTSPGENSSPLPKEVLAKFYDLTSYLLQIQEPKDITSTSMTGDYLQGKLIHLQSAPLGSVQISLERIRQRSFHTNWRLLSVLIFDRYF